MADTVEIVRLAHRGDGVTRDGLYVPFTVPGDMVRVYPRGASVALGDVLTPGPWRASPACRHFGQCGGCTLQHVAREPYLAWKRDLVAATLAQRGFRDVAVEPIRAVGPGTRRRAVFKARKANGRIAIGFYEPESRNLVDCVECPILVPALAEAVPRLRPALGFLTEGETAELHITATHTGLDVSLTLKRERSAALLEALAEGARALDLARLSWNGDLVALARAPVLDIAGFPVALPREAFLQPSREGEQILQTLAAEALRDSARVADLFAGCGTFALALAAGRSIRAVDAGRAQLDALGSAARAGKANILTEDRDLFRRPLQPHELASYDAVVANPPRPGAKAQAEALAESSVGRVLYVSCNPASFARDARILCDGGYRLTRVVPVDQFLWSRHVELAALFVRG